MTSHFTDIFARTRYAELPGLIASLTERAAELGIAADDSLRLQLIVEELFTNTITHGHQGDSEHQVCLALCRNNGVLTLRYEDEAPSFNISKIEQNTASTATVGGLGIGLIRGMCKALRYERLGSRNVTEIEF